MRVVSRKRAKSFLSLQSANERMSSRLTMPLMMMPFCAILVLTLLLCAMPASAIVGECPSSSHINSLLESKPGTENSLICDCTSDPSPTSIGWDINCIKKVAEVAPEPTINNNDYSEYTLQAHPLAFTIKYVHDKSIEITCDEQAPDFKPAMFQVSASREVSVSAHSPPVCLPFASQSPFARLLDLSNCAFCFVSLVFAHLPLHGAFRRVSCTNRTLITRRTFCD